MRAIKLYEQWLSEEDAVAMPGTGDIDQKSVETTTIKPAEPTNNNYKISVTTADGKSFEFTALGEPSEDSKEVRNFKVIEPMTSNSKKDSAVMISTRKDKAGEFDIVLIDDVNKPEDSQVYSGQVKINRA
jgi:hypothetical protein